MSKPSEKDLVILTGTIGSHSYGTATPTSDFDYMSVVVASKDVYLGLDNWGSAGTKDDVYEDPEKGLVEHRYFEIKKFLSMCSGMNPNAIVTLWLNDDHYERLTAEGRLLVENRNLFNSRKIYQTFSGYAHGQLQKMGGVFNDAEEPNKLLKAGHLQFQEWADAEIFRQRDKRDHPVDWQFVNREGEIVTPDWQFVNREGEIVTPPYSEGYLNALLALRSHSKEEAKRIKDGPITGRMGKKRKELRAQYGFDTKFAFHTIRLMKMCIEFLRDPDAGLKVYRKGIDADFLYSIRTGAFTQEDIKKMADDLFAEAKEAIKTSPLPEEPDYAGIHDLSIQLIESTL